MPSYRQFCPVAKAMELLDECWTMLVVRELLEGSKHFSDLRRGVPKMSPALLSKRRREPPRWRNRRADRPWLRGELEVAMHEVDRHAALTDGCCHALHRSGADIADGEDSRGARFESERLAIGLPL
jgi:hypothetical protein